ncbi:hypothetical protein GTX14_18725 [Streptomyces sp. SID4944]|nr:hypothetical protein [Streptomyces sp. SID4944]
MVRRSQRPQPLPPYTLTEPTAEQPVDGQRLRLPGTTVHPHQLGHSRIKQHISHGHHLGKTTASRPTIRHHSRSPPASPPAT